MLEINDLAPVLPLQPPSGVDWGQAARLSGIDDALPTQDLYPRFPDELKTIPNWVTWDVSKIPHDPRSSQRADTTDPSTWCDYPTAIKRAKGYAGVGFVISPPFVGVDLDKCRDVDTGEVEEWASAIVRELDSYTELSPSGRGYHVWVRGELPAGRCRSGRFEMYGHGRYFTVTGLHVVGTPVTIETRDLRSLQTRIESLDPNNKKQSKARQSQQSFASSSASKFAKLMTGDWRSLLYDSQSDADAALCTILAHKHKCDSRAMDAEFRQSGLFRPKWDEKRGSQTYGQLTIGNAIEFVNKVVSPEQTGVQRSDETLDWRAAFKSYDQMEQGDVQFLVKDLFPYGVNFIAGLSAAGKTWFALNLAKSLVQGERFLGNFDVPAAIPVLYLVPESGERPFRARLEKMRLATSRKEFLCRTMHSGPILGLKSPEVIHACRSLKPVVFLDTAIRFSDAQDENSAAQNQQLVEGMFGLITAGAPSVVAIHHSPKSAANQSEVTLENSLRGTGDFGAMSDAVYDLQCTNQEKLEVKVHCVKARDFEPVKPFHIQGRPYINNTGNFAMLTGPGLGPEQTDLVKLVAAIDSNPSADYRTLSSLTGIASGRIGELAAQGGRKKLKKQPWSRTDDTELCFGPVN